MTSQQSPKELVEELNKHKVEVSKLRDRLNNLDKDKESSFKKKDDYSKKIRESIQKIKDSKAKRDFLTQEVKALKPKRDSINKEISSKLIKFEDFKKERAALAKSPCIRESPSRIKQQMERLEFKIETDTVSFEKEKELMKKIKELKSLHEDASVIENFNKKLKNASDEIRRMRKEANDCHRLIQEKAGQSQALHEEMLKISAEIDKMKIEEESAFQKFSEIKKNFNETSWQLKERLKLMNDVKNALDKISSDKKEKNRQEVESFLKSKEDAVNEKIRKRQKLTNEDLLVFQKFEK